MDKMTTDAYLEHYGVLGMKWGVRRDQEKRQLTPREKRARAQSIADRVNAVIVATMIAAPIALLFAPEMKRSADSISKGANFVRRIPGNIRYDRAVRNFPRGQLALPAAGSTYRDTLETFRDAPHLFRREG